MFRTIVLAMAFTALAGPVHAQQCLHGPSETSDQRARRRDALTAARTINTIQNQSGSANRVYLRHVDLANSSYAVNMRNSQSEVVRRMSLDPQQEILPGWTLTLDVTESGYWFIVRDITDPCGFGYVSNQAGLIFSAEPIR